MINFIICDDNKYVREVNEKVISKIAMPFDFNYNIYKFDKYTIKLKNLINTPSDINIYILDLELPNKSGINIAKEIRKVDWDSIIIILTSHEELELTLLKQKLLILDFISKFDNYEERLTDTINMIINKINNKKIITFKCNKEIHHVKLDNIIYVYRNSAIEKTIIVTNEDEYPVRESLSEIVKKLDVRFVRTHRACYVNKEKIESIDFKNSIIYFINDTSIDYLSRNYKKELRELL